MTVPEPSPSAPAGSGRGAPLWLTWISFIVLAAVLGIIAWGLLSGGQKALPVGGAAPAFSLTTFDGQTITLESLKGKVVVVNFWASWCTSCTAETAFLEAAWQQYGPGGQVMVLGVDYADSEVPARNFIRQYGLSFPNGPDSQSAISSAYHISGVPQTFIIDRQGRLVFMQPGPLNSQAELDALIKTALER